MQPSVLASTYCTPQCRWRRECASAHHTCCFADCSRPPLQINYLVQTSVLLVKMKRKELAWRARQRQGAAARAGGGAGTGQQREQQGQQQTGQGKKEK